MGEELFFSIWNWKQENCFFLNFTASGFARKSVNLLLVRGRRFVQEAAEAGEWKEGNLPSPFKRLERGLNAVDRIRTVFSALIQPRQQPSTTCQHVLMEVRRSAARPATVCLLLSGILLSIFNLTNDSRLERECSTTDATLLTEQSANTGMLDADINAFTPGENRKTWTCGYHTQIWCHSPSARRSSTKRTSSKNRLLKHLLFGRLFRAVLRLIQDQ